MPNPEYAALCPFASEQAARENNSASSTTYHSGLRLGVCLLDSTEAVDPVPNSSESEEEEHRREASGLLSLILYPHLERRARNSKISDVLRCFGMLRFCFSAGSWTRVNFKTRFRAAAQLN